MIKNLSINNFKSIGHLDLELRKTNIFIGHPNTGKSNILESLGIFSSFYNENMGIGNLVRFDNAINLFHDLDIQKQIEITADRFQCIACFTGEFLTLSFLKNGGTYYEQHDNGDDHSEHKKIKASALVSETHTFINKSENPPFKFYKFEALKSFSLAKGSAKDFLHPPDGHNLLSLLLTDKSLRESVSGIFEKFGYKVVLRPQDKRIDVQKEVDSMIVAIPYSLVADTLQRLVFHIAAIDTNTDSVLIFEEPESFAFPYYTKYIAERIALDETNQYLLSTHNPYFLLSVIEKTPMKDLAIFITYLSGYQTKVKSLNEREKQEILDMDAAVFFNLEQFIEIEK